MKKTTGFSATAVGSLPHTDPREAIELVFGALPEMPVLPQLGKLSPMEDMSSQLNEGIPGIVFDEADRRWYLDQETDSFCEELEEFMLDYESIVNEGNMEAIDKYAISGDRCASMSFFLEKASQLEPNFLKGQIIGPFTFGTSLVDREKKCLFYDETAREIIVKALTLKALWLVRQFQQASPRSQPVIFMDEPTISQYGTSAFITVKKEEVMGCFAEIASILRRHNAIVGVHCCGKSDWSIITESGVDILNFDGYYFAESLGLYSKEIDKFLADGGRIAWGLVPTMDTDALEAVTVETLIKKYEEAISYLLNKGIDMDKILEASIITPACGAGSLSVQQAQKAMKLTAQLAEALRDKYFVHNRK